MKACRPPRRLKAHKYRRSNCRNISSQCVSSSWSCFESYCKSNSPYFNIKMLCATYTHTHAHQLHLHRVQHAQCCFMEDSRAAWLRFYCKVLKQPHLGPWIKEQPLLLMRQGSSRHATRDPMQEHRHALRETNNSRLSVPNLELIISAHFDWKQWFHGLSLRDVVAECGPSWDGAASDAPNIADWSCLTSLFLYFSCWWNNTSAKSIES